MRIDETKLALIMAKKCLSLTKLVELSSVSRNTLSAARAGKRVRLETIAKIANALEVDIEDIIEK